MNDTLLVGYITAAATLIGSIITAIATLRQNKKLKQKNKAFEKQVEQIASTGIAIGYYFNFIETVYKSIDEKPKLMLEIYDADGSSVIDKKEFSNDKVKIEILMPRSLDNPAFTQVKEKLSTYSKGDIVRTGHKRNFGVNYAIQNGDTLIIVDVPTPLFALEKYLEKLPEYKNYIDPSTNILISMKETENYRTRQNKEIENFKSTVITFIKDGEYAINKVHFNHIM